MAGFGSISVASFASAFELLTLFDTGQRCRWSFGAGLEYRGAHFILRSPALRFVRGLRRLVRQEWHASNPFDFCLHHSLDYAGQVFVQP